MTTENPSTSKRTLLNWYIDHAPTMPLATAKKHMLELEEDLAKANNEGLANRLEIAESLKLVRNRVDELLPKVPAAIEDHDHLTGDRVKNIWPDHMPHSTRHIHMHLCELLHAWKLNPYRLPTDFEPSVDEFSETVGLTRFFFASHSDAHSFTKTYRVNDFIVSQNDVTLDGVPHLVWAVTFTNRFDRPQANAFLQTYGAAIMALSVIYDERRRAVSMDNGRIGFVTADHFTTRETIELSKIEMARQRLGAGYKNDE